jgi:hypothetical protein
MTALRTALAARYPSARRIGVLTSTYVRENGLFERALADAWQLTYSTGLVIGVPHCGTRFCGRMGKAHRTPID